MFEIIKGVKMIFQKLGRCSITILCSVTEKCDKKEREKLKEKMEVLQQIKL